MSLHVCHSLGELNLGGEPPGCVHCCPVRDLVNLHGSHLIDGHARRRTNVCGSHTAPRNEFPHRIDICDEPGRSWRRAGAVCL
jgi:hypothetical protein